MKEIIFIGTSYTFGGGLDKYFNKEVVKRYKEKGIEVSPKKNSFPTIISEKLNIKTRNLGKSGAGIEYLMRHVEDIFYNEDVKDKIFVLEYSNWGRTELYSNKFQKYLIANWGPRDGNDVKHRGYESYLTFNYEDDHNPRIMHSDLRKEMRVFDSYLNRFQDENLELIKRDRYFLNLLHKLEKNNVNYYVICLENVYTVDLENDNVFKNHSIEMKDKNQGYNLCEFIGENHLAISDDIGWDLDEGHPSPKGHEAIANKIIERFKNDKLL